MGRRAIINRIRKAGEELGRRPSIHEIPEVTRADIAKHFSSFSEALKVAGLLKTREQVVKERKKRGYVPPWNYLGGPTEMDTEIARAWRTMSAALIAEIGHCEEDHGHICTQDTMGLVVHHIIPRRCGGVVLSRRNCVVLCHSAHKLQKADLYWKTADDIDLSSLPAYQLLRLAEGTYGLAQEGDGLETSLSSDSDVDSGVS